MEINQVPFKVLSYEIKNRKENKGQFLLLKVIDINNNPCSFFIFNSNIINCFKENNVKGLQDILIDLELYYSNNIWNVRVKNIYF